jgi:hypothetical protein
MKTTAEQYCCRRSHRTGGHHSTSGKCLIDGPTAEQQLRAEQIPGDDYDARDDYTDDEPSLLHLYGLPSETCDAEAPRLTPLRLLDRAAKDADHPWPVTHVLKRGRSL